MKKIVLLIISALLTLGLFTACSSEKATSNTTNNEQVSSTVKEKDPREIAFNQLNSNDKERIGANLKDSKLSKITLKENMGNINDKAYIGKKVYLIDFPTQSKSVPNNIIVYLSIDNNKLIGYGYVD